MWIRMSLVTVLLAGALTGCVTQSVCVSWVDYATAQEAYDDAELVVHGTLDPTGATRDAFGVPMPVSTVDVLTVYKGEPPERLDVVAAPLTCMGAGVSEFPDGIDPLATDDEVLLFLTDAEGGWRTMTPDDGVLPMPVDGALPFEVADR